MSVLKSIRAALVLSFLLLVGSISAQTTVKGTVKDATGEAVIGATVTEQGTKNAAVTDFDGNFTIKVAGNKPLVISYIGMKTKTVDVKGKSTVSVTMEDDSNTLNELVVIGYGAVRKKDLTGSVATVSSDALQAVPVASATEALTGKMAGVQITTTEGSPDAEMKIRVRGGGSITQSNEPLFIVDGFPVSSISDIPASDIEDITVLKDASSTAIYGSRGANGVILVTTKSGQAGKVKVSYNAYISVKSMASKLKTLGTRDYLNWQWELAMLNDSESQYTKMFGNYQDMDIYDTAQDTWNLSSQGQALVSPDYFIYANDNLFSFFGRANYNYKDKYLVSATFRTDGSSKFSDGNRWGFFPSAAVAWRISSEPWMEKTQKWLDDLKLRFSFGTAGNNGIPSDRTRMVWSSGSTSWLNGNPSLWTTGSVMPNPDLTWETTITRNIGLDFTMFGSKLSGSVEFYWNTTKDLLIEFPVTGTGYNTQFRNLGKTENKGVEITLNWTAINKKNWGLSFSGNIGFNKNKVKDLGGLPQISAASGWASTQIGSEYIVKVGHPIGEIYGYVNGGRYEASDFEDYEAAGNKWVLREGIADASNIIGAKYMRPGAMKIESTTQHWDAEQNAWVWNSTGLPENEEGEIANGKVSSSDIVKIGDTNPTANGGFAINARAYGFDFAANFTFSLGNDVYNADKIEYTTAGQRKYRNMIDLMAAGSRWNNIDADGNLVNDIATLEAMNATTTMWSPYMTQNILTDWAIESGSFLRLATLTLGYTLPQKFIKKLRLSNLRFYFSCYNVFCWTKYTGSDPEVSTRNKTSLTPGVDYSAYPKSRQFVFGLNLNF